MGSLGSIFGDLQIHNRACRLSNPDLEVVPNGSHNGPIKAQKGPFRAPSGPHSRTNPHLTGSKRVILKSSFSSRGSTLGHPLDPDIPNSITNPYMRGSGGGPEVVPEGPLGPPKGPDEVLRTGYRVQTS